MDGSHVLAVLHEVGRHHDRLLHHVVEGDHRATGVPASGDTRQGQVLVRM